MSIESYPPPATNVGTITSIAGGAGITNTPEPITSTGTVDLDINSLTSEPLPADADEFPFVDVSVGTAPSAQRKSTIAQLRSVIQQVDQSIGWRQQNATNTTAFTAVGCPAVATTAAGGVAVLADTTGLYVNYDSGTALNADAGWTVQATLVDTEGQLLPDITFKLKTGAAATDIAAVRIWVGLFAGNPIASDTAGVAAGGHSFAFRYSTAAGDANWKTFTKDGAGNSTVKDSGVVVAFDTRYILRMRWISTTAIEFYVNGTLVQTHSTAGADNMPGSTVDVGTICAARNLTAGTARRIRIHRFSMFTI